MDFSGPFTKWTIFVIIDKHTRYLVAEVVRSVAAKTVVPVFDKVISAYDLPRMITAVHFNLLNTENTWSTLK